MVSFPALEVLTQPNRDTPPGTLIPIEGELVLGRITALAPGERAQTLLRIDAPDVARRHTLVMRNGDQLWLHDMGSTNGTDLGGARVRTAALAHGDIFAVSGRHFFRVLCHAHREEGNAAMEEAIAAAPDDAGRWAVYADWLVERQLSLGERILRPVPEEDARWLGRAGGLAHQGLLTVRWAFGLPRAVVLRNPDTHASGGTVEAVLPLLTREPAFRFMRELELDVGAFALAPLTAAQLAALPSALEGAFPLLERLVIGPGSLVDAPAALAHTVTDLRRGRPRLQLTADTLCQGWGDVVVEVTDEVTGRTSSHPLPQRPATAGPRAPAPVRLGAYEVSAWFDRDRWQGDGWHTPGATPHEGGRRQQLRDGDVCQPAPGVTVRFTTTARRPAR